MNAILGKTILNGEFSGKTIVLHIGESDGDENVKIMIRVREPWDYSSCLGAVSSDNVTVDPPGLTHLDEVLLGLIGAKVTLVRSTPGKFILECGSIHIEGAGANPD